MYPEEKDEMSDNEGDKCTKNENNNRERSCSRFPCFCDHADKKCTIMPLLCYEKLMLKFLALDGAGKFTKSCKRKKAHLSFMMQKPSRLKSFTRRRCRPLNKNIKRFNGNKLLSVLNSASAAINMWNEESSYVIQDEGEILFVSRALDLNRSSGRLLRRKMITRNIECLLTNASEAFFQFGSHLLDNSHLEPVNYFAEDINCQEAMDGEENVTNTEKGGSSVHNSSTEESAASRNNNTESAEQGVDSKNSNVTEHSNTEHSSEVHSIQNEFNEQSLNEQQSYKQASRSCGEDMGEKDDDDNGVKKEKKAGDHLQAKVSHNERKEDENISSNYSKGTASAVVRSAVFQSNFEDSKRNENRRKDKKDNKSKRRSQSRSRDRSFSRGHSRSRSRESGRSRNRSRDRSRSKGRKSYRYRQRERSHSKEHASYQRDKDRRRKRDGSEEKLREKVTSKRDGSKEKNWYNDRERSGSRERTTRDRNNELELKREMSAKKSKEKKESIARLRKSGSPDTFLNSTKRNISVRSEIRTVTNTERKLYDYRDRELTRNDYDDMQTTEWKRRRRDKRERENYDEEYNDDWRPSGSFVDDGKKNIRKQAFSPIESSDRYNKGDSIYGSLVSDPKQQTVANKSSVKALSEDDEDDYDPFCPTDEMSLNTSLAPPFVSSHPRPPFNSVSASILPRSAVSIPSEILARGPVMLPRPPLHPPPPPPPPPPSGPSLFNAMPHISSSAPPPLSGPSGFYSASHISSSDMILPPPPMPPLGLGIGLPARVPFPQIIARPPHIPLSAGIVPPPVGVNMGLIMRPGIGNSLGPIRLPSGTGQFTSHSFLQSNPSSNLPQVQPSVSEKLLKSGKYSPFSDNMDVDEDDEISWEAERAVEIMVEQRREVPQKVTQPEKCSGNFPENVESPTYDDKSPIPQWKSVFIPGSASFQGEQNKTFNTRYQADKQSSSINKKPEEEKAFDNQETTEVIDMDVESPTGSPLSPSLSATSDGGKGKDSKLSISLEHQPKIVPLEIPSSPNSVSVDEISSPPQMVDNCNSNYQPPLIPTAVIQEKVHVLTTIPSTNVLSNDVAKILQAIRVTPVKPAVKESEAVISVASTTSRQTDAATKLADATVKHTDASAKQSETSINHSDAARDNRFLPRQHLNSTPSSVATMSVAAVSIGNLHNVCPIITSSIPSPTISKTALDVQKFESAQQLKPFEKMKTSPSLESINLPTVDTRQVVVSEGMKVSLIGVTKTLVNEQTSLSVSDDSKMPVSSVMNPFSLLDNLLPMQSAKKVSEPSTQSFDLFSALKLTSLLSAAPKLSEDLSSAARAKVSQPVSQPLPDVGSDVKWKSWSDDSASDEKVEPAGSGKDDKYVMKLSRQERVIEEVKKSLKPFYSKRKITKEEYKAILRKAVPKICNSKSGEINPTKIKDYVVAYVTKELQMKKYVAKKKVEGTKAKESLGTSFLLDAKSDSNKKKNGSKQKTVEKSSHQKTSSATSVPKKLPILKLPLPPQT